MVGNDIENTEALKIFIGWDSREDIAFQVAKASIEKLSSVPVEVIPIKQKDLRKQGLYTREKDKLASTEFTFTRYLVPYLADYKGWALFIDCDFLLLDDVAKLFEQADNQYAIMCAQHDYTPKPGQKMDGQIQTVYPRKNWSSMMLINCEHEKNIAALTVDEVNNEDKTGAYFHRFQWLDDNDIGEISHEWNWLVGWYSEPEDGSPKALHYTEGGPWFDNYKDCEYATEWNTTCIEYYRNTLQDKNQQIQDRNAQIKDLKNRDVKIDNLEYIDDIKTQIQDFTNSLVDPQHNFYKIKADNDMTKKSKVAAINTSEVNLIRNGIDHEYDKILAALAFGANGYISSWKDEKSSDNALIIRGVGKQTREALHHCWETNRDFYYVDTGYFGNGATKRYHRLTKNSLQFNSELIDRPDDRLQQTRIQIKAHTPGRKILVCPPSDKVMAIFNLPNAETWTNNIVDEIKKYTDRPIEVRLKPDKRSERITTNTIYQAMEDTHCLVTYNSIAATEALLYGVSAIALGPNAASALCPDTLENIDNIEHPDEDLKYIFAKNLAYNQFTEKELRNGTAWRIIHENS